jgi:hypothetical protein
MEAFMKLTIPAILAAALIASPAVAQYTNSQGTTSQPGASSQKDVTTSVPKAARKHMASSNKKHHSKHMKSNAQPGPGNSSNPAASTTKEDVTPKSR